MLTFPKIDETYFFMLIRVALFYGEVLVAELLFIGDTPRKKRFWLWIALGSLVGMLLVSFACYFEFIVIQVPDILKAYENSEPWAMAVYFGISALLRLLVWLYTIDLMYLALDSDVYSVMFISIAGYASQHIIFSLYSLLMTLISKDYSVFVYHPGALFSWVNAAYYLGFYLAFYLALFGWVHHQKLTKDFYADKRVLFMGIAVLIINLIAGESSEIFASQSTALFYSALCSQIAGCTLLLVSQFLFSTHAKLVNENETIQKLMRQEAQQYRMNEANIALINMKAHDIKHWVASVKQNGVQDQAALDELDKIAASYDSIVRTDNPVLNTVLTQKSLYCQKNGIRFTVIADPNALPFMSDGDIYSLLGNLLDNAIEAVIKLPLEQRVISLTIKHNGNFVSIQTNNPYSDQPVFENGLPQTTKGDTNNHGFGVKSVKYIAEKYGGGLSIAAKDGVFVLQLILPYHEAKAKA
jgi:signal transduction histidine kinase